jgi:dienelactone hydrolase
MSDHMMARLAAHDFSFRYEHLQYPDAGHGSFAPRDPADPVFAQGYRRAMSIETNRRGGTMEGNIAAQADSWPKVLRFFRENL